MRYNSDVPEPVPRMDFKAFLAASFLMAGTFFAPDAGAAETRGRTSDGFVPERVDTTKLHGPSPRPRQERPLYQRVEEDVDRGAGRIENEQTYEIRRSQEDRDRRMGRLAPRREFDRIQEEEDRRARLQRAARKAEVPPKPAEQGIVVDVEPSAVGSTLARHVAEQEQLLDAARERYQTDLRTAEAARDAVLRAAEASPREKALANRRFQARRAELTRGYQLERRKILGSDE